MQLHLRNAVVKSGLGGQSEEVCPDLVLDERLADVSFFGRDEETGEVVFTFHLAGSVTVRGEVARQAHAQWMEDAGEVLCADG